MASECEIQEVGKSRNGNPRFWCRTHGAPATGPHGVRLDSCEAAHLDLSGKKVLRLDPSEYSGGIGIWGAVDPIFNSTAREEPSGVHVHARKSTGSEKQIDETFDVVEMVTQTSLFGEQSVIISKEAAISFYISSIVGLEASYLFCDHCGSLHLDAGFFAANAHRKHLCHSCGRYFSDTKKGVSNPVAYFRKLSPLFSAARRTERADRRLDIRQKDFPGGLQIWASNPALVWTGERAEEQGVHVHAFEEQDAGPVIDDTFSEVAIDGHDIPFPQVAHFMAQQTLEHIRGKIVAAVCPNCDQPHFDQGQAAFVASRNKNCEGCGASFEHSGRRKIVVSNPLVSTLRMLRERL